VSREDAELFPENRLPFATIFRKEFFPPNPFNFNFFRQRVNFPAQKFAFCTGR
jgi:hypothetical protein